MNAECLITFNSVVKEYRLTSPNFSNLRDIIFNPRAYLKSLKKKAVVVLDGISFSVNRGECLAVIGRNGAGKSTILSLIARILKPTRGNVAVNGKVAAMLELGSGFHPDLSGRENIYLNAILHGLTKKEVDAKLEKIIEFSGLGSFIDEPVRIYSSGMLAKLGFSIIINVDADILIVDEVLAVGDSQFQTKCWSAIEKLKRDNISIVLVSHNINDVRRLCNDVVWIENGKIKMSGDVETVTTQYELAAGNP